MSADLLDQPPAGAPAPGGGYWSPGTISPGVTTTVFTTQGGTGFVAEPDLRFSRRARSPLPHLAAAVVTGAVAVAVLLWNRSADPTGEGPSRELARPWWLVLVQGEPVATGFRGTGTWFLLAAASVFSLAIVGLARRIGQNARWDRDRFGGLLALAAVPLWSHLPLVGPADAPRDMEAMLVRVGFTLCLLVVQLGLVRSFFVARTWRAARLPAPLLATVLWLPNAVAWTWLYASYSLALSQRIDGRSYADLSWRPTPFTEDLANALSRLSLAGVLLLLVVAAIAQHVGIGRDRAALRAHAAADPRGPAPLPSGAVPAASPAGASPAPASSTTAGWAPSPVAIPSATVAPVASWPPSGRPPAGDPQ